MLTGTGLRVNTDAAADDFGASITFPRGLASDGTTCVLFDARAGYELNVETGIATRIGSVSNFLINEGQLRGATYHENTDQFVFWGNSNNRFYAYNRQNGIAANLGLQFASAWDFWALASLNGVLYAIDRAEDALYIIDTSAGTATRVGTADEFGIGTGNVQSLCVYDGNLYAFSSTLNRLILIDETDGTASIVNAMDLPDGSPEAAVEHGGNLYYAGSSDDALFRMYDVLWDETITNPEIDEGGSGTLLDLSTVSQDAASFALQGTNPSWISVSGNNLVATDAPDVRTDTNYDAGVRATRDGVSVNETIQVTVRNLVPPNTAPAFAETSYAFTDIAIAVGTVVGVITATDADDDPLTYTLTGADASKFAIDSSGAITAAERLDHETTYSFNVVANDGTDTASVGVSVTTFIQLNLTGTGVSLSNPRFGAIESYARAAASDGTTAYNFGRTQGYSLNVATGASVVSGSVWSGSGQIRGATYHNSQVLVYIDSRNIHVWTPGTGFNATALISNLRYAAGSGFSGTPSINGFASHQGVLYVADGNEDHLFSVGADGVLTAVGSGYGNRNIGGMTSYEGRLLGTDNTNDRLVIFDPSDGTLTNVANNALLGSRTIDFLLPHDTQLYGGQFTDGLLRFHNVLWDETITNPEIDEGGSGTLLDLSTVSQDAASFALQGTNPSWISVSGNNLVATNAPSVDSNTNYDAGVRATRSGVNVDETIQVTVRNLLAPVNTAPEFDESSYAFTDVAIAVNTVVGTVAATDADNDTLSYTLTGADADKFDINSDGQITVAEALAYSTVYNFNVVADDSTDTASVAVTITAETTTPRAPTVSVDSTTHTTATITITAGNDGGETLTDWEYELDGDGTWNSFGSTDTEQTISNLEPETGYSVKVRGVNSEGDGVASAAVTATTGAAPNTAPTFSEASYAFTNIAIADNTVVGTVEATDADDDPLTYTLTGADASKFAIDSSGAITAAEALDYATTYSFNVVADDSTDTASVGVSVTTITEPTFPVWQTGTALEFDVDAGADRTINVANLVADEDEIVEVYGAELQSWMSYDASTQMLTITNAPTLREDTDFTVRLRAKNTVGTRNADVVITVNGSVLASLHNSLFFKAPVNYESGRVEVRGSSTKITETTDNDHETFSTEDDIDIDMSDGSDPTKIDYVFIKYKGTLTSYTLTPTGGSGSAFTRTVPTTIKTFEGSETDLEVNGFKHDLFPVSSQITATSVRMRFTGSNLEIYALMLLELGIEVDANSAYVDFGFNLVDRGGAIQQSARGRGRRAPSPSRWKWEYDFGMILDTPSMDALRDWMERNPNFAFAVEFSRDPEQVFPAFFPSTQVAGGYWSPVKFNGEQADFQVAER